MPLFDLFKKSPKKEPVQSPEKESIKPDPSLVSPEMQKKRYDAAMEFLKHFQEKIPLVGGKPHAGTVLSVAARLAGSSLYRSLHYKGDINPGVVVLSEEVNEAWPQLMNLFAFYCKQNGMDVMSKSPVTVFPEKDKPLMSVEQVLQEYQDQYHEVMKNHGLDYLNGARAGMVICSIIFQHHSRVNKDIDPQVAAGIIAMGVVEGAKTAPPPLGSGNSTGGAPGKTVKNNNRLVLGERDVAIQDALDNGGIFIDLNPEILRVLQAGNVDPYLIYEQGMLKQIEEKIPRIDFVQANVDQLFEKWKSKPEAQIPIHVRLIIWLKHNANQHGYAQSGNSWILK
ncbi:MAG: hypothetical protein ACXW4Q_15110 [Anaerolineales bacterium]